MNAMPPPRTRVRTIIERLVGPERGACLRFARALGLPPSTVYIWPRLDAIPAQRIPAVLALARRLGVAVSAEELLGIDTGGVDGDGLPRPDGPRNDEAKGDAAGAGAGVDGDGLPRPDGPRNDGGAVDRDEAA